MASGTIFATVGTTKFDLFISTLTSPTVLRTIKEIGYNKLIIQIGNGTLKSIPDVVEGVQIEIFRFKDSIIQNIQDADFVISHAGAGSCLEVLEAGKPLLVVINEELMDNHQIELAEKLHADGHVFYCTCKDLNTTLCNMKLSTLKPFTKGNPNKFVNFLETLFQIK